MGSAAPRGKYGGAAGDGGCGAPGGDAGDGGDGGNGGHGGDVIISAVDPRCLVLVEVDARQASAEDFSRLDALLFTAMAWIFIPAYCFAIP